VSAFERLSPHVRACRQEDTVAELPPLLRHRRRPRRRTSAIEPGRPCFGSKRPEVQILSPRPRRNPRTTRGLRRRTEVACVIALSRDSSYRCTNRCTSFRAAAMTRARTRAVAATFAPWAPRRATAARTASRATRRRSAQRARPRRASAPGYGPYGIPNTIWGGPRRRSRRSGDGQGARSAFVRRLARSARRRRAARRDRKRA